MKIEKLRSFTIVELSVSLLIGGIVISLAYYTYFLFINQYKTRQKKSALMQESLLFRKAINSDIDQYEFIRDSASLVIFTNASSHDFVQYNFEGNFIVRNSSYTTDTFYVKKLGFKFYHVNDSAQLVNRMDIFFQANKENFNFIFCKSYSSKQLLMEHYDNEWGNRYTKDKEAETFWDQQ